MSTTNINWDRVAKVIKEQQLPGFDEETVVELVNRATDTWLEADLETFDVTAVEMRVEKEINGLNKKAFIDLCGDLMHIPSIVDWKVRVGKFTDNWEHRLEQSEQGLYYWNLLGDSVHEFRRVVFRAISTEGGERVFANLYDKDDIIAYNRRERQWDSMQHDQLSYGVEHPWAENRDGCRRFGPRYPCEFEPMCLEGAEKPTPPQDMPYNLSYSTEKEFKRCPERARLITITKNLKEYEEEPSQAPAIGSAFHAAIAEVYRQAYSLD